jgi:hypothetical protein
MPNPSSIRAATLDGLCQVVENIACVRLPQLPPFTTLLVQTVNSLYRMVITSGCEVTVQGGAFFPDPTAAYVAGTAIGGSALSVGCIGVGLPIEIRSGDQRIITSRVLGICLVPAAHSAVH